MNLFHLFAVHHSFILQKVNIQRVRVHRVRKTLFASNTNGPYLIKALSFYCKSNRTRERNPFNGRWSRHRYRQTVIATQNLNTKDNGKFSFRITREHETRDQRRECSVQSLFVHFLPMECLMPGTPLMNSRMHDADVNFCLDCSVQFSKTDKKRLNFINSNVFLTTTRRRRKCHKRWSTGQMKFGRLKWKYDMSATWTPRHRDWEN